jgi:O-antigen ligase
MRLPLQRPVASDFGVVGWLVAAIGASAAAGLLVAEQPIAAFDAAVVAACAALIAWRPYLALLFLLLLRGGFATAPSGVILDFLTLAAGGVAVLACARAVPGKRVIVPYLLFLLLALVSVPIYPSWDEGPKELWLRLPLVDFQYLRTPSNELRELIRLAGGLVAFVWAAWAVRTPRQLTVVMGVVVASAVYPIVDGLIELASGRTHVRSSGGFASILGPFSHPNGFASFLVIVLVISTVAFFEVRRLWLRVGLALLIGGGVICLLFTYTRASWVGFAIAVLLLGLLRYRRLLIIGVVAVSLAALAAPGTTKRAEERFNDLSKTSEIYSRNSWSWRTGQWEKMVPFALEEPVLGRGFGSYARNTVTVFGFNDAQYGTLPQKKGGSFGFGAHNDYVKSLVESGVLGVSLWVLTLLGVMSVAARARRIPEIAPWATAVLTVAVALSLVSLADNIQSAYVDMLYLFALAGAVAGAARFRAARRPVAAAALPEVGHAEPEPDVPPEPQPEPEPEPEPEPDVIEADAPPAGAAGPRVLSERASQIRAQAGAWLRRRLR